MICGIQKKHPGKFGEILLKYLSINIITYNRIKFLKRLLINLRNQKISSKILQNQKLNINIFDNSEDKNNYKEIKKFNKNFNLKYIKHKKNIGFFNNYIYAIKNCGPSEYIWILSDDEKLSKNAIQNIIKFISIKKDVSIISPGYTSNLKGYSDSNFKLVKKNFDKKIFQIGYISNLIFKKNLIKKSRFNFKNNKAYPHFEIFLKIYNANSNWYYSTCGLIFKNQNNVSRSDEGDVIDISSYINSKKYIKSRTKADYNEYSQLIRKLKITEWLKIKSINNIFQRNLRPWFVLHKAFVGNIGFSNNYNKNYLIKNLSFFNKLSVNIINYFPKKIIYLFFIFKNIYLKKLINYTFIKEKDLKLRFLITGSVNTLISYLIGIFSYYLLFDKFGFHIMNIVNIFFGVTISFLNFKFFTFKTDLRFIFKEYFRSFFVYGLKILLGSFVLWLLLVQFKLNIFISQAVSIFSTVIITFFGHKNFTFNHDNKS